MRENVRNIDREQHLKPHCEQNNLLETSVQKKFSHQLERIIRAIELSSNFSQKNSKTLSGSVSLLSDKLLCARQVK